ncbi:MAG: hypothetical protein GY909_12510 [Oligoflexia bacterium]|nr:hypothetical protein [Oligoflexia bacterium]
MKNLFFLIITILVMNVSFAGNVGEEYAADCGDQVQSTRFQETTTDAVQTSSESEDSESATNK